MSDCSTDQSTKFNDYMSCSVNCMCTVASGCARRNIERECEAARKAQCGVADPVNNPNHYVSGAVECIDAIQASMSVEAFRGYCKGNVQKYVWRYEEKGGAESLRKAEWYLKRLLATFDALA